MLIYILPLFFKANVAHLLQVCLLARQLRRDLAILHRLTDFGGTPLFVLDVGFFGRCGFDGLRGMGHLVLELPSTVAVLEFGHKLNIEFFLLLLLYFAHLLLLHPLNNLQFLLLFDLLLIFISLLHQLLHIVVDIFIDGLQFIKMGLMASPLLSLQTFDQPFGFDLCDCVVCYFDSAFEVVALEDLGI